jgi:hypothetical protein
MTYFVSYKTPHGSTNVIPYGNKQLAIHAAAALKEYYSGKTSLFIREDGRTIPLDF